MAENQNKAREDSAQGGRIGLPANIPGQANTIYQDSNLSAAPNVLDQYASYTYNIAWYLVKPEDIERLLSSRTIKTLPKNQLIVQSGGIAAQGRNSTFSKDYFIERMVLETGLTGKAGDIATTMTKIELTVMEPYGITFVQNLQTAVNNIFGTTQGTYQGKSNGQQVKQEIGPAAGFNLIVVTFYGYDDAGNLVKGGQDGSLVEKYYLTSINTLEYKVSAKHMVEYTIQMAPQQIDKPQSIRAVVPFPFEFSGGTVQSVLAATQKQASQGNDGRTSTSNTRSGTAITAPQKAGDSIAKGPAVRDSLVQAMNKVQLDAVKQGIYTYPDEFSIEFTDQSIATAKVTVKDGTMKGTGVMSNATAAQQVDKDKQSVQSTVRQSAAEAGKPMVKIIDNCIRNSTYITGQANTVVSEKTGQTTPNNTGKKDTKWFKISMQAIPKKFDPKRNDFAYLFKYIVSPYKLANMKSQYFEDPKSPGIHKRYEFMFTGKNTQVLDWEMKLSQTYILFMSKGQNSGPNTAASSTYLSNYGQQIMAPRSGQSSQGAAGKTNEVGASAADYLYDMEGLQKMTLNIIGDPAWLLQGESYVLDSALTTGQPFLADGTINADQGQVLFELVVNTPQDYDLSTGLMDPNTRPTLYKTTQAAAPGMSAQSYIIRADSITSEFNQGKFTQRLVGQTLQYNPDQTVKQKQAEGRGK